MTRKGWSIRDFFRRRDRWNFRPFWWWKADTQIGEVLSAWAAGYWAIVLALPGSSLGTGPLSKMMLSFFDEPGWAVAFGLMCVCQSTAMCGRYDYRTLAAWLGFFFWAIFGGMLLIANPLAGPAGLYALLAVVNLWVLIRRTFPGLNRRGGWGRRPGDRPRSTTGRKKTTRPRKAAHAAR